MKRSNRGLDGHRSTFNTELEAELRKYLITMETMFFGSMRKDLQCLAYQLAEQNHMKHNFSHSKKAAGVDWLNGFLLRHSSLSVRASEATSNAVLGRMWMTTDVNSVPNRHMLLTCAGCLVTVLCTS